MRSEERAYFDEARQRYLHARSLKPYAALAESGMCRGARILDAGCGAGSGSALLAAAGAVVHAVDSSYPDVVLTASDCASVTAVTADVCRLPYRDARFDLVISSHVLEHLDEPRLYLSEIRRVLLRVVNCGWSPQSIGFVSVRTAHEPVSREGVLPRGARRARVPRVSERRVSRRRSPVPREREQGGDEASAMAFARPSQAPAIRAASGQEAAARLTGALYPSELSMVDASDFRSTRWSPPGPSISWRFADQLLIPTAHQ